MKTVPESGTLTFDELSSFIDKSLSEIERRYSDFQTKQSIQINLEMIQQDRE